MFLIRADGNAEIGAGHLMRCLTIGNELRERTDEILFLCADESSAEMVRGQGLQAAVLGTDCRELESELAWWEQNQQLWQGKKIPPLILVDSYYATGRYLEGLKRFGKVVLMDDMEQERFPVDAVINYNAFANPAIYEELYQGTDTRLLIGSSYIPIRRQFQDAAYSVKRQVEAILITTGGGDSENIAEKILKAVYRETLEYHIVAGRFHPCIPVLKQLESSHANIKIHTDVTDMAGLMRRTDLAITAGGSTIYELAALGIPFLCFSCAKNQEKLTEYVGANHIAGHCGAYHRDAPGVLKEIEKQFELLRGDLELRVRYAARGMHMVDGKGASRLAESLSRMADNGNTGK